MLCYYGLRDSVICRSLATRTVFAMRNAVITWRSS